MGHDAGKRGATQGKRQKSPQSSSISNLAPGLYITATPIGNASDITLRALKVLKDCDVIVAEDTRVTARLLAIHGISRPLLSYNDHNAPSMRPRLLAKLRDGARLALVSDAGTPLISDPGLKLIRAAFEENLPVIPIPGPSAVLAALSVAGLPTDRFLFAGFLPAKRGARRAALETLRSVPASLVFFESPGRLAAALADMADILGPRDGAVGREITKLHEEFRRAPLTKLAAHYAKAPSPKGEITVVTAPPASTQAPNIARIDGLLSSALAFMPVRAAAALVAKATGAARRTVYARALVLKKSSLSADSPRDSEH
ncbi:MAG: 16S rRNA (cytidine(1402)-2'-O)-methyltransferase [Proteobacteria bacterium]|nr:16S rRNA (cytidine(1402)-2'-O)-methyltransferase [Pseudomonadota bacterium]